MSSLGFARTPASYLSIGCSLLGVLAGCPWRNNVSIPKQSGAPHRGFAHHSKTEIMTACVGSQAAAGGCPGEGGGMIPGPAPIDVRFTVVGGVRAPLVNI